MLRKHRRSDRITRTAEVAYDADADCPMFRDFLDEILPDREIQTFLQQWYGYAMTGVTTEQLVVLFHGKGANGKSTLMKIIGRCMGDYTLALPFASLLHDDRRRGSEATPDLARLPGARLVTAAEPETGARFSESMIKQMTGGEPMAVRHLNKGFFEFDPVFKLALSFNKRPTVRGHDEGIWRRLLLVPFDVAIAREHQDKGLDDRLKTEAAGVLNWMIGGFEMWRKEGLRVPDKVRAATESYRSDSDPIGLFLRDGTRARPGERLRAGRLYEAYRAWCKGAAMEPVNGNLFGRILSDKGLPKERSAYVYYLDIELVEDLVAQAENMGPDG